MKTATTSSNAITRRSAESYGVTSNVEGIRYLYRDIELIDGKAVRNLPNEYKGCSSFHISHCVVMEIPVSV